MSELRIFGEEDATAPLLATDDHDRIAAELAARGVRFERWAIGDAVDDGASEASILERFRPDIDRLMAAGGYRSVDVVHMHPEHPEREALRRKFLDEHTHGEDEVRFFVAGRGLFTLHLGGQVLEVLCEGGDLIGVPAGTPHWFDMGPAPRFTAIRLFTHPEGWVARFTGSAIASRFNRLEA